VDLELLESLLIAYSTKTPKNILQDGGDGIVRKLLEEALNLDFIKILYQPE